MDRDYGILIFMKIVFVFRANYFWTYCILEASLNFIIYYIMIWYILFLHFKQTLTLQTWNTYKWKDSRLAWTPTDWNNITTLKFSRHDTIWVPDVFVFKIVDEVKQFGDFQYIVSSDGSVLYIPIEIHKVKKNPIKT